MLFWIIIALIVALTVYAIWEGYDWVDGVPALFFGSGVGTIILFLCAVFISGNTDLVSEKTYTLRALGTTSNNQGAFFLGSGYIDGKRVLNYIQQGDDKAIRVAQAKASDSTIFEGSDNAVVIVKHYDFNNGWILPWPIGSTDKYEFRIPNGSVAESYTLENK